MSKTINYGVDLGTTNSAISKFDNGKVETFANPLATGSRTLPSVVGYKKGVVVVGEKARRTPEYFEAFKRKMGTTEAFNVKALNQKKTPVDFSAEILKQLKQFASEDIESLVITVPAAFNSVQSAATKEAAEKAGIKQVVLLQEPIAASLAYANGKKLNDSTFLVYDLGGGTFDVALVKVTDGELKVIDNEGDNFLGGHDLDQLIVDNIIVPFIEKESGKKGLAKRFKSQSDPIFKYRGALLEGAELAKIALSSQQSAFVDGFSIDIDGSEVEVDVTITRSEFEDLIKEAVDATCEMVKSILSRNSMDSTDLDFVLMVGGSTYIPYVRSRTSELLNQEVKTDIDPTTAISVGAAFFAATKAVTIKAAQEKKSDFDVRVSAPKSSKEIVEDVIIKVNSKFDDSFTYEITRGDNGFTTNKVSLKDAKFYVELPLEEDAFNSFSLNIFDGAGSKVYTNEFGINSAVSVSGQPLTSDVCIEVDDENNLGETKLRTLLQKNTALPNKTKWVTGLNKKLVKGDSNDSIEINIYEGPSDNMAIANDLVGSITISGADVHSDVLPGSEIEIRLSCGEDRTYTCEATLLMTDQSFKKVFNKKDIDTNVGDLKNGVSELKDTIEKELKAAEDREDYETCQALKDVQEKAEATLAEANSLSSDDVTDKKQQLDKERKNIAQSISDALKDKRLKLAIDAFESEKALTIEAVNENGNDSEQTNLNKVLDGAPAVLATKNIQAIDEMTSTLTHIRITILQRTPDFLKGTLAWLIKQEPKMSNQQTAASLITSAKLAAASSDWDKLRDTNNALLGLLPRDEQMQASSKIGF